MIAILAERLFQPVDETTLVLLSIFEVCSDGRHVLLTRPVWKKSNRIVTWLDALPRRLRGEAENVLQRGIDANSQMPRQARRFRVDEVAMCRWDGPQPVLDPRTALRLLRTPLRLLVEDRLNDGAFVRKMLSPTFRGTLMNAIAMGWVELEHGGGIDAMRRRVDEAALDPATCARLWVMFDSDGRDQGDLSDSARQLEKACCEASRPWPLTFHRLARRSIENYIPLASLTGAGHKLKQLRNDEQRGNHWKLIDAAQRLEGKRYFYNMKSGLLGDVVPAEKRREYRKSGRPLADDDLPPLFRGLDASTREALRHGFGADVADLFHDLHGVEFIREADLHREVHQDERERLANSLFEGM